MACFLVPAAEAVISSIAGKALQATAKTQNPSDLADARSNSKLVINPFVRKLRWLSNLLWGGSALLAFEHLWHGEITPWFPFLTAAGNPADASAMLREMATRGTVMAVLVTVVWVGMVLITNSAEKHAAKPLASAE